MAQQIPLVGQTYEHRYRDVNYQRCVNWYPSPSGDGSLGGPACLMPTPGLVQIVELEDELSLGNADIVTGMHESDDILYVTAFNSSVGTSVYKLDINVSTLTVTSSSNIGTITNADGDATNKEDFASNETYVVAVAGGTTIWYYNKNTTTAGTVACPNSGTASSVVFLDGYFIVIDTADGKLYRSDINDPTTWDALNFTTPEAKPDTTIALEVLNRELWVFCEESVEIFYNDSGSTNFGFTRRGSVLIDQGCKAKESVVRLDSSLIWMDDRGYILRSGSSQSPYGFNVISTDAMHKEWERYSTVSDAEAYGYSEDGHNFYVLTFPTADKTWVYDTVTQMWHERMWYGQEFKFNPVLNPITESTKNEHRHWSRLHARYKDKNLVISYHNNELGIMSNTYYEDLGEPIVRIRTTPGISSGFNFLDIDDVEIHLEAGTAQTTGQGSDPKLMMRNSWDGGRTWSSEMVESIGQIGEYGRRVRYNRLGTAREWMFELKLSDNVGTALIGAWINSDGQGMDR